MTAYAEQIFGPKSYGTTQGYVACTESDQTCVFVMAPCSVSGAKNWAEYSAPYPECVLKLFSGLGVGKWEGCQPYSNQESPFM